MKIHRLAKYFPVLEGDDFDQLVEDIKKNGQLEPIITVDDQILDGVNRYRACQKLGIEPKVKPYRGGDPLAYVISMNIRRRHMNQSQKAALAVEMLPEFEKEAKARKEVGRPRDRGQVMAEDSHGRAPATYQAAKAVGTSGRSVEQAKRVKQEAPAAFEEVVKGTKSVDAADKELTVKRLAKDKIPENERIHGLLGEEEFAEWASWAQIRIKVKQRHALHELSSDARREISKLITGIRSDIAEITGGE